MCPSYGSDAEFHLARLEQFFAAGYEGGACGADVVDDEEMLALDERFMERPAFAMEICRNASRQMASETMEAITLALEVVNEYDKKKAAKVYKLEDKVDH